MEFKDLLDVHKIADESFGDKAPIVKGGATGCFIGGLANKATGIPSPYSYGVTGGSTLGGGFLGYMKGSGRNAGGHDYDDGRDGGAQARFDFINDPFGDDR